jgi:hypothetical protein
MIKTSTSRKLHRILGVIIGIQVLIWTISGAVFVWNDIESVRGDDSRTVPEPFSMQPDWVSPATVDARGRLDANRITDIGLVRIGAETYYRLTDESGAIVLASVLSGQIREPVSRKEAVRLAQASYTIEAPVAGIELLEGDEIGPHHEYRGGELPAWVVQFDHSSRTRVYVSQRGGTVTRHRNQTWRMFDFFWMLHTMDYRGRDDFNHSLIKSVSLAAIALTVSGYLLFSRTSRLRRKRR